MLLSNDNTLEAYPSATGDITLPSSLDIGYYAFYNNSNITSVTVPGAVIIYDNAFSECANLYSVSLPNVISIGDNAFSGCTSLGRVSLPATPPTLGSDVFSFTNYLGGSIGIGIVVPPGKVTDYTSAWGVLKTTPANQYLYSTTTRYGRHHPGITIVESTS
jgi:hypothetical protein